MKTTRRLDDLRGEPLRIVASEFMELSLGQLRPRDPAGAFALLRRLFEILDGVTAEEAADLRHQRPLACREGCSWCCHLTVAVSPLEAITVAAYLRASLAPEPLAELRRRVALEAAAVRPLSPIARRVSRRPCVLLEPWGGGGDEGGVAGASRCSAYLARPLLCRGANSTDADACRGSYDLPLRNVDVPVWARLYLGGQAANLGLSIAADALGLDPGPLELAPALDACLDDPGSALALWLDGDRALFASARTASVLQRQEPADARAPRRLRLVRA